LQVILKCLVMLRVVGGSTSVVMRQLFGCSLLEVSGSESLLCNQ